MVKKAGTRNTGVKESLDGLKKLVHKIKLEDASKQLGFDKAVERLIKIVDGMKEKSNKMEKVTLALPSQFCSFFPHDQGVGGALEKLGKQMVKKIGAQNTGMKQMVEKISTQNRGLKQMVEKFGTQNAGMKESVDGLKGVVQKMKLNGTMIEKVEKLYFLNNPIS